MYALKRHSLRIHFVLTNHTFLGTRIICDCNFNLLSYNVDCIPKTDKENKVRVGGDCGGRFIVCVRMTRQCGCLVISCTVDVAGADPDTSLNKLIRDWSFLIGCVGVGGWS